MKLGTRLLRDGVIGLSELEAALRAQVLYGGRLGTNLVELGFLDVDTVGKFLALALGAPEATRDRFERAPSAAIDRFGAELAQAHTAFPLGPEPADPRSFAVAVLDPNDAAKRAALAEALGAPVVLYAAAEMRLFYYLEKHYGVEREVRYVRAQSPPREQGKVERRRVQGAPRVVIEPRRSRGARISAAAAPERRGIEAITRAIAEATHRDHIGEAVVSYAPDRVEAMVVLLVRDGAAMGWRAYSTRRDASETIGQLSLPLSELSALKLAHDASETYWGPPPRSQAHPMTADARLLSAVGIDQLPDRLLVVPVTVRDRVVNLIAATAAEIDAATRSELAGLASLAADAYLRLIRSRAGGDGRG